MGDRVRLFKDGHLESKSWSSEERKYLCEKVSTVSDLINVWSDRILLEEGATLKSLMLALNGLEGDLGELTILTHCPLAPFIEEGLRPSSEPSGLLKIVVGRNAEISHSYNTDWEGVDEEKGEALNIYEDVYGWGPAGEQDEHFMGVIDPKENIRWGISFSSTNNLADCELEINEKIDIIYDSTYHGYLTDEEGKYLGSKVAVGNLLQRFSIGDFIHALFWELSWYGLPEKRDETKDEIHQTIEDIKSGKAQTKPFNFKDLDALQDD